jgi:uncharacterized repeat protein (TIGR01451 family)
MNSISAKAIGTPRTKVITLVVLTIAIASLSYGWHRVVSAQAADKSNVRPDAVTITEYPLPNPSPAARPFGVASRFSDHSIWFTESAAGKIGRITQDGTITAYLLPGAAATSQPTSLVFFGDDLWFTEYSANKIGRINSKRVHDPTDPLNSMEAILLGTNFTEFSVPTANSHPFGITSSFGADSAVFFTEETGNALGYITNLFTSPTITEFPVPTASAGLQGIAATTINTNARIYFVEANANKIGYFKVSERPNFTIDCPSKAGNYDQSKCFREQSVPTANSGPFGIVQGPDNNVWFTEKTAGKIGKAVDTTNGINDTGNITINDFSIPTANSTPLGIVSGPDGALWFTESTLNSIGQITTAGGVTERLIPTADTSPAMIACDCKAFPSDTNATQLMWFTENSASVRNAIGKIDALAPNPTPTPTPTPSADLQIGMSASPSPVTEYQNLTYTVSIKNNGPATAAAVQATINLSSSSHFVSASSGCSGPVINSGGTVNCALSPDVLANGATATLNVVVQFTRVGTFNDANASVQSTTTDLISGNNTVGSTITVQAAPKPANDDFANAITAPGNSGCTTGTNIGATVELSDPDIAGRGYGKTVWYKWTAPDNGFVEVKTAGSNFDTVLGVYQANTPGGTVLYAGSATNDDSQGGGTSLVFLPVVKQQLYYFAVSGYQASAGQINLCWTFTLKGVPPSGPAQSITSISPDPFIFFSDNPPASSPTLALTGQNLVTNSKVVLNAKECTTCQVSSSVSNGTSVNISGIPVSYFSVMGGFIIYLQSRSDNNTSNAFLEAVIGIIQITIQPNTSSTVSTPATKDGKPTTQTTVQLDNQGNGAVGFSVGQVPDAALTQGPLGTGGGRLITSDGASVISNDGGSMIGKARIDLSGLIGDDGSGLLSEGGNRVIHSNDANLIGDHGTGKPNPGNSNPALSGGSSPSASSNSGWYIVRNSSGQLPTVNVTHNPDGTAQVSTSVTIDQTSTPSLSAFQSPQLFLIVKDPVLVQFGVTSTSINESGPAAQITVTRTGANLSQPASVDYATSDGTAQAGSDYTATSGTLNFAAGETSKNVTVPITDDNSVEAAETFKVTLTNPVNSVLDFPTATVTVTINDNDTCAFALAAASTSVSATGGTGSIGFTGNGNSCGWTAVSNAQWITITSAASGSGNGAVNYSVTANPNSSLRSGTITIGAQTFTITQTGIGCSFTLASPSISVAAAGTNGSVNFTASAGDCGWTVGSSVPWITITSGGSGTGNSTVNYSVAANLGSTLRTGTITIGGQTFTVNQAAGLTVLFSAPAYTIGEGAGSTTVTVTRSGDASSAASVRYATSDGTAKEGKDYTAAFGVLTFAAGETSKTFPVLIIDNGYVGGTRGVNLTLSNPTGSTLSAQSTAVLNITDNDSSPSATNPLDQQRFFVQEHYYDFLGRFPDQAGWDFWTSQITNCGANQGCLDASRVSVSASFFLSIEFQQTGYLVEKLYKAAYGDATGSSFIGGTHSLPVPIVRFNEFLPDTAQIGSGVVVGQTGWETVLENGKQAFAADFVQRSRFTTALPTTLTPAQFVDKLFQNAGVTPAAADRTAAINEFGAATTTTDAAARGRALRRVAENTTFNTQEFNRAFVLMQYFGYLRRDPNGGQDTDHAGYEFWLTKLNAFNGNYLNAEMVKAFITSIEYRQRFSAN